MNPFGGTPAAFGAPAPAPAPAAPSFGAAPAGGLAPLGVSVPIELKSGDGSSVTVDILFGPEHAANPQALMALVQNLFGSGFPVRVYRPKAPGFGGGGFGGGGGFNRGGGFGGGGGWR